MDQELLLRYLKGDSTESERLEVVEWTEENPDHLKELQNLRRLYDLHIWQADELNPQATLPAPANSRFKLRKIGFELAKIAAIFVVALVIYSTFPSKKNDTSQICMQSLNVPAGQRAELTLSDGTRVWLNANTTLTFPNLFTDGNRIVTLNGEGFFQVTRDKQKPFIVKTSKYNVKVWGTSFNVMAYKESELFETSLLEGSVEVMKPEAEKGILLKPNERAYLKNNNLIINRISHFDHLLWRDGIISFDNESFPEMVRKLELYFDLRIEVKNQYINKYHCTGKFRTKDGIEHIMKVLQLSNRFKFKVDEKQNLITID